MHLEIKDLKKSYGEGSARIDVLKGISTQIEKGQMCVILGPSGSGKSTFLNLIGGLDSADSGKIIIDGMDIASMKSKELADYRRDLLGFIFQFYNLIPNLTVYENILVCKNLTSSPMNVDELLDVLNIAEHKDKFPAQLSGGQQQRCAIARALVKNPELLLCDEPTGALDSKTSKEILILLEKVNRIYNTTMLIVTHNTAIKDMVHKVIKIKDGLKSQDYNNTELISAENIEW